MRITTGLRVSAAAAGAVCALAILPGGASAAFDADHGKQCQNASSIKGRGASFQRQAQLAWGAESLAPDAASAEANGFGYETTPNGGCAAFQLGDATHHITFEPLGSGDGRKAVGAVVAGTTGSGVRDTNVHFGAADEPPLAAEIQGANNGPDKAAGTADDAVLLTVPVAQSAVAVVVKLPDGCTVPRTDPATAPDVSRQISRAALAGAFNASPGFTTWSSILPGIAGEGCGAKSFKRVVRQDSSGTTYAFKNYLRDIAPDFDRGLKNIDWPNDTGATQTVRPATKGAGQLLDTLSQQTANGGIGYADLAAARDRGYDTNVVGGSADLTDSTFWLGVQRKDLTYQRPGLSDLRGTTNTGSNCRNVTYGDASTGALPKVTESWYNVTASASAADYPLCALTYELVWQDMAKATVGNDPGVPDYTQGQARAVKDYLGYIVNINGGQAALAPSGYQTLPAVDNGTGAAKAGSVLAVAQAAQASITWNAQAGDTTPPGEQPPTQNPPVQQPPVQQPPVVAPPVVLAPPIAKPPVTTKPSALVTVGGKATASKGRRFTLAVSPSAAGRVSVVARLKVGRKLVTVATGSGSAKRSGALKLTLKPSSAGKRALRAGRTVTLSVRVTFKASNGATATATKSLKVKVKR